MFLENTKQETLEGFYSTVLIITLLLTLIWHSTLIFPVSNNCWDISILSTTMFNVFLENAKQETLEGFYSKVSINLNKWENNQHFTDDIDLISWRNIQRATWINNKTWNYRKRISYGISSEKSKIMTNSGNARSTRIMMNGEHMEEVRSFKYLGIIIISEGSSTEEIKARISLATSAMTRFLG